MGAYRWNDANVEHIERHGVSPEEAEYFIDDASHQFPRAIGDGKFLVWGKTEDGHYLQVIFIYSPPGFVYVIHARPLTKGERKQFRR